MLVSVVIPVYNRVFELKRALNSVLKQTIQDFEVLVIDDFSENDLKTVCAEFNDNRIKHHRLEKKGNGNVCRNYGIKLAQGTYIAMLDSDDEWLENHLELKHKRITETRADGIFGSVTIDDSINRKEVISRSFLGEETMINYLLSDGSAPTPSHFYKAVCAKEILWDETLLRHQDYDFSVRFADKYVFIPSSDVTCIVHWKKGEERVHSIESQVDFINKYKARILPKLYNAYYYKLFFKIQTLNNVPHLLKKYAQEQSTFYINYCSLNDFMAVNAGNKSKFSKLFCRIKFLIKLLFV